ncbi:hypothetical protein RRG08_002666 [Elysia crispata]|uniref:Uncharacterized protein n=1 Tax=Elysia crispata TaxID=231223 RepID=A0AAE0XU00_9GAST|nr:hypothetical protein RRG08_002666 [Elysia crispata]
MLQYFNSQHDVRAKHLSHVTGFRENYTSLDPFDSTNSPLTASDRPDLQLVVSGFGRWCIDLLVYLPRPRSLDHVMLMATTRRRFRRSEQINRSSLKPMPPSTKCVSVWQLEFGSLSEDQSLPPVCTEYYVERNDFCNFLLSLIGKFIVTRFDQSTGHVTSTHTNTVTTPLAKQPL